MEVTESIFIPRTIPFLSWWSQPGNSGNTGGTSPASHGTYSLTESALVSVSPAIAAPNDQWDTFYFYRDCVPQPDMARFAQPISFTFPTQADIDVCEAVEWELEKCVDGNVWNMGWQLSLDPVPAIKMFDYTKKVWVGTNIPLPAISPGMTLLFETEHILRPGQAEHVALWVNWKFNPVSFIQPMFPNRWLPDKPNYLHYSFQLDSKGKGVPFTVRVDVKEPRGL